MSDVELWEIRVPKSTEWSPAVAVSLMNAMLGIIEKTAVSFHIKGTADGVRFVLFNTVHPAVTHQSLAALIRAYYPAADVVPYVLPTYAFPFYRRYTIPLRLSTNWFDPFPVVTDYKTFDPLTVVSQTMQKLEPGEMLSYMIMAPTTQHLTETTIADITTIVMRRKNWTDFGSL